MKNEIGVFGVLKKLREWESMRGCAKKKAQSSIQFQEQTQKSISFDGQN